jgi:quinolinate synthase
MHPVHPAYVLWSVERLVQGEVINQITVDLEITREALVALNGMLPVP